jgi:hypothetical protein
VKLTCGDKLEGIDGGSTESGSAVERESVSCRVADGETEQSPLPLAFPFCSWTSPWVKSGRELISPSELKVECLGGSVPLRDSLKPARSDCVFEELGCEPGMVVEVPEGKKLNRAVEEGLDSSLSSCMPNPYAWKLSKVVGKSSAVDCELLGALP